MSAVFVVFGSHADIANAATSRGSLRPLYRVRESNQFSAVLTVNQTARLCEEMRKSLRRQKNALRRLMKDRTPDSEGAITAAAESLRKRHRESIVLEIQVNRQICKQAELLAYELGGMARLWHATLHLARAQNEVAELFNAVYQK